jgi:protein-L-isoaspartate O-methyltransferase
MKASDRERFDLLLRDAILGGTFVKLTLGKPSGDDPSLKNLFVRPVSLKSGQKFAFVWRHATKDVSKNHDPQETINLLGQLIGSEFLDAHLFSTTKNAQLETGSGEPRLRISAINRKPAPALGNDRVKKRAIDANEPWLKALGVTGGHGRPIAPMADKFRQIEKFAEILDHMVSEAAALPKAGRLRVFDMGCGKGYLTFAASEMLGDRADVVGVESRQSLVDFCNKTAAELGLAGRLSFRTGSISDIAVDGASIVIALHACDTATDDALAKAIKAGTGLIMVAPCCQKEVRPQIVAPPVLAASLSHGIFEERHAEFATDALRALLLEWSGYKTRAIEFISTEHTAKNVMITAIKVRPAGDPKVADRIRDLAAFYGIRRQSLARQLDFALV